MSWQTSPASGKRLPIGIQTFSTLREEGCCYVDKTPHIERLLDRGSRYFLSRPRRFGKSLLLDTIKALFEGREPLFRGLHVHDRWDWGKRHPVLRLSFGSGSFTEPGHLHGNLMAQLDRVERSAAVSSGYATAPERFGELIELLRERAGERVAVLVDECDKPMLDALGVPEVARANRDYLRGLCATIKDFDEHVRFVLLTGVSKFSKVSVFSGLNNLQDITLDRCHADICGYTDADLDGVFAPELPGLDRREIQRWYNGYSWLGDEGVYNPFDILLLFETREFRPHWFETGTPRFLIDMLIERQVRSVDLDGMVGTEALLSALDVDDIGIEALLFQTGYLTIKGSDSDRGRTTYRLGYPNHEVRQSSLRPRRGASAEGGRAAAPPGGLRRAGRYRAAARLDRLLRCPLGLSSRLSTRSGRSERTVSRHLPAPSPRRPDRPGAPRSSSRAVTVREPPAGTRSRTSPDAAPASSVPATETTAGEPPPS